MFAIATGKLFAKLYMLAGTVNNRDTATRMLCSINNRMRLTTVAHGNTKREYLTVYFTGHTYDDIAGEVGKMDDLVNRDMRHECGAGFEPCDAGEAFSFVYLNYNGKVKTVKERSVTGRRCDPKRQYCKEVREDGDGYTLQGNNRKGCAFVAMQYLDALSCPSLSSVATDYVSCVDFQIMQDEEINSLGRVLDEAYGNTGGTAAESGDGAHIANVTYMLDVAYPEGMDPFEIRFNVRNALNESGIIVAPCTGAQGKVVDSLSTFGLVDFHCMRNVPLASVKALLEV